MAHDDIFGVGPILNGKVLNINMTRTLSGDTVADHIDCRHVVFVEWGQTIGGIQVREGRRTNILRVLPLSQRQETQPQCLK